MPRTDLPFELFERVEIHNLNNAKFNGKIAKVRSAVIDGRIRVRILDEDGQETGKLAMIKPENLCSVEAEIEGYDPQKYKTNLRDRGNDFTDIDGTDCMEYWYEGHQEASRQIQRRIMMTNALPDKDGWERFLQRPPALGMTHEEASLLSFSSLRYCMRRNFICVDGVDSKQGLFDILENERSEGKQPIPKWFVPRDERWGQRHLGYQRCGNKCLRTENFKGRFGCCTRCKAVYYCSRKCQKEDWKRGHKKECKDKKKEKHQMNMIAMAMENMTLASRMGVDSKKANEWAASGFKREKAIELGLSQEDMRKIITFFSTRKEPNAKQMRRHEEFMKSHSQTQI